MGYDEDRAKAMAIFIQNFEKMNAFGGKPPIKLPEFVGCDAKFPEEVFDPSMRLFLNDFARAFQVDFGVAAALALSTAAMSCRGRFRVVREGDHSELLALYSILRLPPSHMKSEMVKVILRPFDEANLEEKAINEHKKMDLTDMNVAKKRAKILENEAATCYDERTLSSLKSEIRKIRINLDEATRQYRWRIGLGLTPEGVAKIAYEEGGTLAIVGSELGKLKKFPANRDDVLLAGWDGSSFESNTKKDPFKIDSLCLNLLLFVQSETSRKFLDVSDFIDDGLISRFMTVTPQLKIFDKTDQHVGILSKESKNIWKRKIQAIFENNSGQNVVLQLNSSNAKILWNRLRNQCKELALCAETKPSLASWYGKAAGTALRIAGILHLLDDESSDSTDISLDDIDKSICILKFYESHTIFMLQEDREKTLKRANRILDIFKATKYDVICEREVYRKVGNGEPDADYRLALKLLREYQWINISGKRRNKNICLNPRAREVWDERSSI